MSIISILELAGVAHLPKAKRLIESVVLIEGYKEAQVEFGSVAGEAEAKQAIDRFRDLVNRNQVQGNERNIDYWRKQGWDQFSKFVEEKSQIKSKRQQEKTTGRAIVLRETPDWLIVIPLDKDASCFHGRNTDWCTTKRDQSYFEQYFYRDDIVLIYFLQLQTGNKWAIACHTKTEEVELFDINDKKINESTFQQQTGFDPMEFRTMALNRPEYQAKYKEAKQEYQELKKFIQWQKPFTKVDIKLEQALIKVKDFDLILQYCMAVKGEWDVATKMAKRSPSMATQYARDVMHRRWTEAEPFILNDLSYAELYQDIFGMEPKDWAAHKQAALKNPIAAVNFAVMANSGRMPEIEPLILTNAQAILTYVYDVLRRKYSGERWKEGESALLDLIDRGTNNLMPAVNYASDIIGDRWPELEAKLREMLPEMEESDDYDFAVAWENYSELFPDWLDD